MCVVYVLIVLDPCVSGTNLQTLDAHAHYVQGVAWDPLGKYVTSLSSDRTCRIYMNKPHKSKGIEKINYVCQQVISKADQPLLKNSKVSILEVHICLYLHHWWVVAYLNIRLNFLNVGDKISSLPWWDVAIFLQKISMVSWWFISTCARRYLLWAVVDHDSINLTFCTSSMDGLL